MHACKCYQNITCEDIENITLKKAKKVYKNVFLQGIWKKPQILWAVSPQIDYSKDDGQHEI